MSTCFFVDSIQSYLNNRKEEKLTRLSKKLGITNEVDSTMYPDLPPYCFKVQYFPELQIKLHNLIELNLVGVIKSDPEYYSILCSGKDYKFICNYLGIPKQYLSKQDNYSNLFDLLINTFLASPIEPKRSESKLNHAVLMAQSNIYSTTRYILSHIDEYKGTLLGVKGTDGVETAWVEKLYNQALQQYKKHP